MESSGVKRDTRQETEENGSQMECSSETAERGQAGRRELVGKSSLAASFSLLAMNPLESLCSWEFFAASCKHCKCGQPQGVAHIAFKCPELMVQRQGLISALGAERANNYMAQDSA